MSRRHHHHIQPYDYDRFHDPSRSTGRDRERDQTRGIEYQDDSLSSINSDEESYLHHQHPKEKKSNFYSNVNKTESTKPTKSEKPTNHETYHPKEVKIQNQHQHPHPPAKSDPTSERLGRLEAMLEQLIKRNNQPSEATAQKSTVPEKVTNERRGQFALEPRRHDFTTSMWINKIQEICVQNNWDEKTTISYMGTKMSGIIKTWYNTLPSYDYTWPEWKILISKVFPDNTDFITTLKRLVTRLKQANESMATYYFSKMYLIEACKITGEDAVSCLIDGLNNQRIQEQAKSQNYLTPETLYSQFLMVLPAYTVDYSPSVGPTSDTVLNNWYYQEQEPNVEEIHTEIAIPEEQLFEYQQEDPRNDEFDYMNQENTGFHVNEDEPRSVKTNPKRSVPVHSRLDKRFIRPNNFKQQNKIPLAAKMCTVCGNRGHLARNCRKAEKMMYCKIPGQKFSSRFFKDCFINHQKLEAFIDTGCTTVTFREKEVKKLNLDVIPANGHIETYGGKLIRILGEIQVVIQLDSVKAQVRAVVVPDHVQNVPIVVGQEFLNQKNVCVFLQNDTLKIFEASSKLTD